MLLSEWLAVWQARGVVDWEKSNRAPRASIIRRWIEPFIGHVPLRDLGTARVVQWRAEVLSRTSRQNWNKARAVLSAALGAAVLEGLLPANPVAAAPKAKHRAARPRALSPREVEAIRAHMPSPRDRALVSVLAYCGLRPEEALALEWGSVGRVLVIDAAYTAGEFKGTKTGNRRTVEVIEPVADDLAALDRGAWLVFRGRRGGPLNLGYWRRERWAPAVEAAGVRHATPYDLRHTFASLLIHEGRSPILVAAAMGHSDIGTVWRHYAHLFDGAGHAEPVPLADAVAEARASVVGAAVARRRAALRVV